MKNASMMLIVLSLLGAAVCAPPQSIYQPPAKSAAQSKRELVENLEQKTVALVRIDEDKEMGPYCSGVWIEENKILTALHCVKDELFRMGTANVILYQIIDDPITSGRAAQVKKIDEINDLALLETQVGTTPKHPISEIADDSWDGEHVNIVGHTIGLWWTYIEGVISSTRSDKISTRSPELVLQISSPAWFGNSGGGAFDDEGKLLGISSFISPRAPMMSFFVHRMILRKFLASKG